MRSATLALAGAAAAITTAAGMLLKRRDVI